MSAPRLFVYPFGTNADDLASIPDSPAIDGSVSYYNGWTPLYELDLLTDPTALPIPRGQMNQLFLDITSNIQEYQQYGTPQWYSAITYPIFARVYYLGQIYENQVPSNTATPGTDDTWLQTSGDVLGIPTGTMMPFAGTVIPTGYLGCDGSAVSRATYSGLLSVISFVESGTLTNTLNTVSGLADTSQMYVGMPIEGTGVQSGTVVASIVDANNITMSKTATTGGSQSLRFFSWGNGDGSTTFNVPNMGRRVAMGSGGSPTSVIDNAIGSVGGTETVTLDISMMPSHNHPGSTTTPNSGSRGCSSGSGVSAFSDNSGSHGVTVAPQGGGGAHNNLQPSAIVLYMIKT